MLIKLRRILFSMPVAVSTAAFAIYLAVGFFVLPVVVKWQIEKQFPEGLGHPIHVGAIRFNPLALTLDVGETVIGDPKGNAVLSFKGLHADFELRSVIDLAWTFVQVTVDAPILHLSIDKDGRHNFTEILDRLRAMQAAKDGGSLPPFSVTQFSLNQGRIEFSDSLLADPLVTRIEPLRIDINNLSSIRAKRARYRLTARTVSGETLGMRGDLTLDPVALRGRLTLGGVKAATLGRGLSRQFAFELPAGTIDFSANFDVTLDGIGSISGRAQNVDLGISALSLYQASASVPLLDMQTISLKQGIVDFDKREAKFTRFRAAKGRVAASVDKQGILDWGTLIRTPASPVATAPLTRTPRLVSSSSRSERARVALTPWSVSVQNAEVSEIAVGYFEASSQRGVNVAALGFVTSAAAEIGPSGVRVEFGATRLTMTGARLDSGLDKVEIPSGHIEASRVSVVADNHGFDFALNAPRMVVVDAIIGEVANRTRMREILFEGKHAAMHSREGRFDLDVGGFRGKLADLQMQHGANNNHVRSTSIAGDTLSLAYLNRWFEISGSAVRLSASGVDALHESKRVTSDSASFEAKVISASFSDAPTPSTHAFAVDVRIKDAAMRLAAVSMAGKGASSSFGRVAAANFGAGTLAFTTDGGLRGDGLYTALSDTVIHSSSDAAALLRLGKASMSDGTIHSKDRVVTAGNVSLANGKAQAWLDAQGNFNWLSLFGDAPANSTAPSAAWRFALKSADIDDIAVGFEDRRRSPALAIGLDAIRLRVIDLDTRGAAPIPIEFQANVASGGEIAASGQVRTDSGVADLKVSAIRVALAPLQTYLSELAELRIATGTMSAVGRLRYGAEGGTGAKLIYDGKVALDKVLVEEIDPKRPFVAWDSMTSGDVVLMLTPNRLDVGEVRIVQPSARFIVAGDRTVNLTDVLKKPQGTAPASVQPRETRDDPFPVTVSYVRVAGGTLDFADLSLPSKFVTRMHEMKGVITGLSNDVNRSAKVQLDARVDKYGTAKIRGQINVLQPVLFTEIDMDFRNLDMPALSPYVVKFAGYRVAAGKLALDLQYRVRDRKLVGENNIVVTRLKLGEKVESAGALDLPLELAIAILSDSEGMIDIEVPVSGDLNDPKFDLGAVTAKAVGNLLVGIITAPFRALSALFGTADRKLDTIEFDAGSSTITPSERQKLEVVAHALEERPALRLVVPPTYAAAMDAAALKSIAVRSEIITTMGIELTTGEDPGPIDTANPRVRRAVEAVFNQRYAPGVLPTLKRRALETSASASKSHVTTGKTLPDESGIATNNLSQLARQNPDPPPQFYQSLVDRLIDEESLPARTLMQLAIRRAEAIVHEITTVGGVSAARVLLVEPRTATDANNKVVPLRMELDLVK